MKKQLSISSLVFALAVFSPTVLAHAEHGQAQYGGVVAEAGVAQFELVSKSGQLIVYVSNHGQAVATAGATGKLTILEGAKKLELDLKPAGDNRLEAKGNIVKGAKVLISVKLPNSSQMQARVVF
ncbi:MAG: hypothetical protein PHV02_10670 [Rhodocyclaceae bacterium]|nr:hypothetical protein [Rhodocyclaceae bacterium]